MATVFLYSLSSGMMIVLATGRTDQIAWKFLRLIGFLVVAIATMVLTWSVRGTGLHIAGSDFWSVAFGSVLALGAIGVVFLSPFAARRGSAFRWLCLLAGICGLAAAYFSNAAGADGLHGSVLAAPYLVISRALEAFLLGSITIAWLLGHAYLTATEMTIAPLRHFTRVLSWAVAMRAMFVLVSVATAYVVGRGTEPSIFADLTNSWIAVSLRVVVGLIAVGVFTYMVRDCVRIRATQSATGILYFGSIFAYVGELASQHLLAECGWPL